MAKDDGLGAGLDINVKNQDPLGSGRAPKPIGGFEPSYHPPINKGGYMKVPTTQFGTLPASRMYLPDDAMRPPPIEDTPDIKVALVQAGLLDPKDFGNPAVWDANAASAYAKVLEFANMYGLRAVDALKFYPRPGEGAGAGTGVQQPTETFMNPADVQAQYRSTSQSMTGQEQDTGDFTDYYHGLEAGANAADVSDYYKSVAGQGKMGSQSHTRAPSVQGAAEDYLLQHNAAEVAGYGVASRMNDFFSMLGGQ